MAPTALDKFLENHPSLAREMVTRADSLWILSKQEGEILWGNPAFLDWIGYTLHEFTRPNNPIKWTDITTKDASLEADLAQAHAMVRGEFTEYHIRKHYIPKNSSPVFVTLAVRRFPKDGDFKFFVVEVFPMMGEMGQIAKKFEDLAERQQLQADQMIGAQKAMVEKMELMAEKLAERDLAEDEGKPKNLTGRIRDYLGADKRGEGGGADKGPDKMKNILLIILIITVGIDLLHRFVTTQPSDVIKRLEVTPKDVAAISETILKEMRNFEDEFTKFSDKNDRYTKVTQEFEEEVGEKRLDYMKNSRALGEENQLVNVAQQKEIEALRAELDALRAALAGQASAP